MKQSGLTDLWDVFHPIYILYFYIFHVLVNLIVKFVRKSRLYKISLNNSMLQGGLRMDFGGLRILSPGERKMDMWIFWLWVDGRG